MMAPLPPILHFNTLAHGGAATAARKIHDSMVADNLDSRFFFVDGDYDQPGYRKLRFDRRFGAPGKLWRSAVYRFRKRINTAASAVSDPFGWPTIPGCTLDLSFIEASSILHLHWIVDLVDYRQFFRAVPETTPIVWTLHDMNPLSGGCHYAGTCTGFVDECHPCPQLTDTAGLAFARKNQDLKRAALEDRNLHLVANSRWLEDKARKSRIFDTARSFRTIHIGIDLESFRPRDHRAAQQRLGVGGSRTVVAFGSSRLDTVRKGFADLCSALSRPPLRNEIELLTFGERGNAHGPEGVPWHHVGSIDSPENLATVYSAADLFVMPSLEEAFGQTGQEALACATPVVAFETGGVPEFVQHKHTGLLADAGNVEGLAGHILTLVRDPILRAELGLNGRRLMEAEYSLEHQKNSYLDLYRELVP